MDTTTCGACEDRRAVASPICTEISRPEADPAGRKHLSPGRKAFRNSGTCRRRASSAPGDAYDILRAAEVHRYSIVMYENVPEFATDWELYGWWVHGFKIWATTTSRVAERRHIGGDATTRPRSGATGTSGCSSREGCGPDLSPRPPPGAACAARTWPRSSPGDTPMTAATATSASTGSSTTTGAQRHGVPARHRRALRRPGRVIID